MQNIFDRYNKNKKLYYYIIILLMNLIIGDSHILALENYNNDKNNLYQYSASSIRGLINQNSSSGTGNQIINLVNSLKYDKLFIMFGKVDLEWVYPYKLKKENIEIIDFIEDTTNRYIEFINKISDKFKVIYVMGLHLPSLNEEEMLNCINENNSIINVSSIAFIENNLNPTKQIGSLKKRTEEIIMFNNILRNKINNINCKNSYYIDITDELLDKETNTCKEYFIKNGDHHLKRNETGLIWYEKYLKSAF
jgi:hypothetical protein